MDDFITLSCPSCGGQLRLESNTTTYTCHYCGRQHRLRAEDVEEYGRCPICHRNDKVEIVRAIHSKGGALASRLAPPENPEEFYPYLPKPKPTLLEKPILELHHTNQTDKIYLLKIAIVFLSILLPGLIGGKNSYVALLFVLVLIGVLFIFLNKVKKDYEALNLENYQQLIDIWQKQNRAIETTWVEEVEAYKSVYTKKFAQYNSSYQKLIKRYESIYYCHRDDCVFIPGESGYAPSVKIEEFLFTDPLEKRTG